MWLNRHRRRLKSIICLLIYEGVYAIARRTLFFASSYVFSSHCTFSFGKLVETDVIFLQALTDGTT